MLNVLINQVINKAKTTYTIESVDSLILALKIISPKFSILDNEVLNSLSIEDFIFQTSGLDEKQSKRKKLGVYYTPKDLCNFIISKMLDGNTLPVKEKILDPTCGNSEFLISYLEYIIKENNIKDDKNIVSLITNIYGNDIDLNSLLISKVRILLLTFNHLSSKKEIIKIAKILNKNFYNLDAVNGLTDLPVKFDYVIGNPPYVEHAKYPHQINEKFGNVYANVLKNSLSILKQGGKLAFVIPISYVSTARMNKIRDYVVNNTKNQYVYNFADRPDCLFPSVHQKLTVLITEKGKSKNHCVYSSGYNYWYKPERHQLFDQISITEVKPTVEYIPKLGSVMENDIFDKVKVEGHLSLFDILNTKTVSPNLYLNMRATFWIKCFLDKARSSEYKGYDVEEKDFIYCLLNSSLFFWYWTVVSDCWHITSKELKSFKVIPNVENETFKKLSKKLQQRLEETKKYIGSKQTEYEYKHKDCKDIIDYIDDELGKVYSLTQEEIEYLKGFKEKYRMSKGI